MGLDFQETHGSPECHQPGIVPFHFTVIITFHLHFSFQEVASPSLKLAPYSQGTVRRIILENPEQEPLSPLLRGGNNVIYEKTIRKYELLNPDQARDFYFLLCVTWITSIVIGLRREKQYQYALQHTQSDQSQFSQPVEHVQVVQQCQQPQSSNCYDIGPVSVNDVGRGIVKKVTIQPCEPVTYVQEQNDQLDCRYFGELLAELHHKSNELHNCLLQHVEKLGGRRYEIDSLSQSKNGHSLSFLSKQQTEDIESLIPKGVSEPTKQQIRYLLEMRVTADKSMRLVLATFSNLREELVHLQDDLGRLEMDKSLLEKDLAFKESQVKEYETLLASVRENNRQQQQALREYTLKCRSLEEQLLSLRHNDGEREFRLKDLEYNKRTLEQEIQNLKLQASSNPLGQTTTDELSSRYVEMINQLREDKDREIRNLRELFRLRQEKLAVNPSQGITKTIITKKYRNQYPILGLLSDDYKVTSPVKESQTIVIEKTGEMWKQVRILYFRLKNCLLLSGMNKSPGQVTADQEEFVYQSKELETKGKVNCEPMKRTEIGQACLAAFGTVLKNISPQYEQNTESFAAKSGSVEPDGMMIIWSQNMQPVSVEMVAYL
ncbi:hypothetical protein JD844_004402 [Phrynosoma platyrhinos]|uniref:POF1B helix-loop-helix domain-containing protein n=1 Tax=Phrynosoma platyrhinos TaxID=52577 RepID=A0ABQ7TMC9_PHRPL|nr:hypothetical protein JD844_004402 [Phrynosoma platyrhinos]